MGSAQNSSRGIDFDLRREHLLKLLEREGMSQAKLATLLNIGAQNMNAMCTNKRHISETTARAVKQLFPTYRLSWLLGDDDFEPTQEEYDAREANAFQEDFAEQHSEDALFLLARANGWKITADECGFTLHKGNLSFSLNAWGLESLREEIAQYADMRFRQLTTGRYDINKIPEVEAEE